MARERLIDGTSKLVHYPIKFNLTIDKSMLVLENCVLAKFLYDKYPEELIEKDTILDSSIKNKYCLKKKKSECSDFKLKNDDIRIIKKCSDILAFSEYYMNRLTSINDGKIKMDLITIRHLLASLSKYKDKDCIKHMKDNPLVFSRKDLDRICRCKSKLFNKYDAGVSNNYDPPERTDYKYYYYDEIKDDDHEQKIGLGPLFNIISNRDNNVDLYIRIFKNNEEKNSLPDEFIAEFNSFWKGDDLILNDKEGYLPINNVIDILKSTYDKMSAKLKPSLTYSLNRDISDLKNDNVSPLDPYIGDIKSRDDDFEVSHSLTSKIFKHAEEYVKEAALYARLLHCIFMDAEKNTGGKNNMILHFSPSESMMWMMDHTIIDRNYPPTIIFTENCDKEMEEYINFLLAKGYTYSNGICKRRNKEIDMTIEWPKSGKKCESFRERKDDLTEIKIKLCNDPEKLKNIVSSDTDNNKVIIVTTCNNISDAEELIAYSGRYSVNIPYMAVLSNLHYISIRYDLHNIVEVGFRDYNELYELHTNNIDNRRKIAIMNVLDAFDGKGFTDDPIPRIKSWKERITDNDLISSTIRIFLDQSLCRSSTNEKIEN